MTAEMLVAQRHQQTEHRWRRQPSDDLMALLLKEGVEGMRQGYRQVRTLLAYGRAIHPDQQSLCLSRYRLPTLLWHYRDDEAAGNCWIRCSGYAPAMPAASCSTTCASGADTATPCAIAWSESPN